VLPSKIKEEIKSEKSILLKAYFGYILVKKQKKPRNEQNIVVWYFFILKNEGHL